MGIKAVLIDYGGVLYRECNGFRELLKESIARFLKSLGTEPDKALIEEGLKEWRFPGNVEQNVSYAAALILSLHGIRSSVGVVRALTNVMKASIVSNTVPSPWAREFLEWIKGLGIKVAIVSNHWCHECVVETLERDELNEYLDAVVTSDLVGYCKPESRIYEAALKLLDVPPNEAVFIDDYPPNVEGALRAGIKYGIRYDGDYRKLVSEVKACLSR